QGATGGTNGILNADLLREVNYYSSSLPVSKANALSAVFDFRQKEGNKEKLKFRGTLGASEVALTADGPISDNTTFIVSVRRSYLQFLFKALGLPFLPTFNDYQMKVKSQIDDKNQLTLISLGALDQNRLDLDIENPDEYQRYLLANLPQQDQWSYAIGGVWKHFKDNGYQTWVLSRNMLFNRSYKYENNDEDSGDLIQDYKSTEAENKFRWENYTQTGFNLDLTYGAGGQYVKYFNNTYQQIFIQDTLTEIDYNSELEFFKYAAFVQATRKFINNRLTLNAGFRMQGNSYSTIMNNPLEQSSPQFSASYLLNDKLSANVHAGRYYQLPPYTALGFRDNNGNLVNRENGLGYISADHYVAGIEYRPSKTNLITLEGFYKDYQNYPFSVKDSISLAHREIDFGNIGAEELAPTSEGHAYGIELLSQNRFPGDITFVLSYTYAISEFKDKTGDYASTTWDNRHILVATASKKFKNNWYAGIKWRFAGGLPYTPYDLYTSSFRSAWDVQNQPYLDYNMLTEKRFSPFHQLDIRVDKSFYFERSSLKVYLDIQNLYNFKSEARDIYTHLDENGNPIINDNNPARYDLRTINNEGSGTILPTIGIIFDF
ncbi:MAG: TonB-dependent receptor plug domain-containing protein, partial [Bacteroidota bacterium]